MKIKLLSDRLIVEPLAEPETTNGGIIMVQSANEKPKRGKVVAIGNADSLIVSVGDVVVYGRHAGAPFPFEKNLYTLLNQNEVLFIEKKNEITT